jgi:hypothetical protein
MDKERPAEKLLEASGVARQNSGEQSPQNRLAQMERLFREVMADLEKDRASVKLVQDRGEAMIQSLKNFCRETLPRELAGSIDKVAEDGVRSCLRPLNESLRDAVGDLDECRKSLGKMSWYWLRDLGIAGVMAGMIAGCLVYFVFLRTAEDAKRFEEWGRKVEQNIERLPPKDKENLYKRIGGRP